MVEMPQFIGIAGLMLIAVGWAYSLRDVKNVPPPRLTIPYISGSVLLTAYSIYINEPIFTILNAAAAALALVHLVRWARQRR